MINIAILGFGTIGSGVAEVLERNGDKIAASIGDALSIKYILDRRDLTASAYEDRVVRDIDVILQDPDVSIVCEMLGGSHPAYDFSLAALKAGKSVVTANKEVVARFGLELLEVAEKMGVHYYYEASVGGAIPILSTLDGAVKGSRIARIDGILNGTTNYILSRMHDCSSSYEEALAEARRLGYAEADPSADVSGADACRKICILAAVAWKGLVPIEDVRCEGIEQISACHNAFASQCGGVIKLIATAKRQGKGLSLSVMPCVVMADNPLSSVNGVFNAVKVDAGDMGELMFYGMGAGKCPTASAVIGDIMTVVKRGKSVETTRRFVANSAPLIDVDEEKSDYCVALKATREALSKKIPSYCLLKEEGETLYVLCENLSKNELKAALADVQVQMLMRAIV